MYVEITQDEYNTLKNLYVRSESMFCDFTEHVRCDKIIYQSVHVTRFGDPSMVIDELKFKHKKYYKLVIKED